MPSLRDWHVVITRPVGMAETWRRRFAAAGAIPVIVPGMAIRALGEPAALQREFTAAQTDAFWIFTSPAAVRHARAWSSCWPAQGLCAVGLGTAGLLRRYGAGYVIAPSQRQDSEGLLACAEMHDLAGRRLCIVTGEGGRGVLQASLSARGGLLREIHVYKRVAPRLNQRHIHAVRTLPRRSILLLSSAEAMAHLQAILPLDAWQRLLACPVVVSSPRLERLAAAAGFGQRQLAAAAVLPAMFAAADKLVQEKGIL